MRYFVVVIFSMLMVWNANAEPAFPPLTGRVVDELSLLDPSAKAGLEQTLAAHEKATSNQVVVAIIRSLQGYDIAEYGYQLGRTWGIGQKGKNNGVILLVAPQDRRVRIEVGYGLEGQLTDAISSNIIQTRILPHFRQQDYPAGIVDGAQAVIEALGGEYEVRDTQTTQGSMKQVPWWVILILPLFFFGRVGRGFRGYYGGYHGGGHRRGGGFRGGGGSFGGGGASGGW